jgi:hypothetical protein
MGNLTPIKAIRAKCLDCSCWQPKEVRLCVHEKCPLFPYRMGKNPNRVGIGNSMGVPSGKTATQALVSEGAMA